MGTASMNSLDEDKDDVKGETTKFKRNMSPSFDPMSYPLYKARD